MSATSLKSTPNEFDLPSLEALNTLREGREAIIGEMRTRLPHLERAQSSLKAFNEIMKLQAQSPSEDAHASVKAIREAQAIYPLDQYLQDSLSVINSSINFLRKLAGLKESLSGKEGEQYRYHRIALGQLNWQDEKRENRKSSLQEMVIEITKLEAQIAQAQQIADLIGSSGQRGEVVDRTLAVALEGMDEKKARIEILRDIHDTTVVNHFMSPLSAEERRACRVLIAKYVNKDSSTILDSRALVSEGANDPADHSEQRENDFGAHFTPSLQNLLALESVFFKDREIIKGWKNRLIDASNRLEAIYKATGLNPDNPLSLVVSRERQEAFDRYQLKRKLEFISERRGAMESLLEAAEAKGEMETQITRLEAEIEQAEKLADLIGSSGQRGEVVDRTLAAALEGVDEKTALIVELKAQQKAQQTILVEEFMATLSEREARLCRQLIQKCAGKALARNIVPVDGLDDLFGPEEMGVSTVRMDPRLPRPVTIEVKETIAMMRGENAPLPEGTEENLNYLAETVPLLGFEGVTPEELVKIRRIVQQRKGQDRQALATGDLVDYAHRILQAAEGHMKGQIHKSIVQAAQKMVDAEQSKQDKSYTPRQNTVDRVVMGGLLIHERFITQRNVAMEFLDPHGALSSAMRVASAVDAQADGVEAKVQMSPSVLFALQALQEVVVSREMEQSMEQVLPAYQALIDFHIGWVLKIKQKGGDVLEKIDPEIRKRLNSIFRFIRSIATYAEHYGKMTPLQREKSIPAYQRYRRNLSFALLTSKELSGILDEPFIRQKGDIEGACNEIALRMNDKPKGNEGVGLSLNMVRDYQFVSELMTELAGYLSENPLEGTLYDSEAGSLIIFNDINAKILRVYFEFDASERTEFKQMMLEDRGDELQVSRVKSFQRFFDILESYL